ncbi:MAG: RecX family transcriptional regulator [Ferruginibacter sp.]|nr:RecX family transcriptional regulator [Ferruginibacter sp.]
MASGSQDINFQRQAATPPDHLFLCMRQLNIGTEKAWQKIKHFCGYQERNHKEVKEKLYGYGLYKTEVEQLISQLIEENYLNEERYAIAYAGGKFRMRQWGKVKIRYEMKGKGLSDYLVKVGLKAIDEEAYEKTLQQLAEAKLSTLKVETNVFIRRKKLQQYLLQKGYETDRITAIVNRV